MLGLFLLAGISLAETSVNDVVCNGKDSISFTITNATSNNFHLMGCPNQDGPLDSSAFSVSGDVTSFNFNPYTTCVNGTDPNNAASYSVDFKIKTQDGEAQSALVIDNQQIIMGDGDVYGVKCTFEQTYTVEADLGQVDGGQGQQVDGEEFSLEFTMRRTTNDYDTEESGKVRTNNPLYFVMHENGNQTKLSQTDFTVKPSRIRLMKQGSNLEFDLFNVNMQTCGYEELDFEMTYDETKRQWNFKYNSFLLDNESNATYTVQADLELCNSDSDSAACTAVDKCNTLIIKGPITPAQNNKVILAQPIYEEFFLSFNLKMLQATDTSVYRNVIHFGHDYEWFRFPSIFLHQSTVSTLLFSYRCGEPNDFSVTVEDTDWSVGSEHTVRFEVTTDRDANNQIPDGHSVLKTILDGQEITSYIWSTNDNHHNNPPSGINCWTNGYHTAGDSTAVWASNPWYSPAEVELSNVHYGNMN